MESGWRAVVIIVIVALLLVPGGRWSSAGQERGYTIQIASVATEAEARAILAGLRLRGIAAYSVRAEVPGLGLRYRVRYGRFRTAALARSEAEREVRRGSYRDFIVSREEADGTKARPAPPTEPAKSGSTSPVGSGVSTLKAAPAAASGKVPVRPEKPVEDPSPPPSAKLASPVRESRARVGVVMPEILGAGGRWEAVIPASLPAERWLEMQFIDVLTGWIGSDKGRVYRTNDGGRVWTEVMIGTRGRVLELAFLDWNRGWVLAAASNEGTDEAVDLFVTTDGGRRWSRKDLTGIERLYRADTQKGWGIGRDSRLVLTRDGGETWGRTATMPGLEPGERIDLADLSVVRTVVSSATWRETLWVAGNLTEAGRLRPGGIWKSDNGGASWTRVSLPEAIRGRSGRFLSVRFMPGGRGFVSGELTEGGGRRWFLLETVDGGESWKVDLQPGRELERARFGSAPPVTPAGGAETAARHGWSQTLTIEADKTGSSTHIEAHLLLTFDGGRTWVDEFRLIGRHQLTGFFIRPDRGWVLTDGGVLLIGRPDPDRTSPN